MAMRQRSSGISDTTRPTQSSYRPTYEDFQPRSELKEEHEAHITHVHLPGFLKEQVRITFVHSPGVIRVHGQRPLGNNKWIRFNQTFPLPENYDASKIHGKFHNGILTITIPKEVIKTQIGPKDQGAAAKPIQEPAALTPSKTATAAEATPRKVFEKEETVPSNKLKEKDNRSAPPSIGSAVNSILRKGQDAAAKAAAATAAAAATTADAATVAAAATAAAATAAAAADAVAIASAKARKGIALLTEGIAETKEFKDKEGVHNENQRDEKRVIPLSSPSPPNAASTQKGRDEIPPKTMEVDQKAKEHKNEVRNKDRSEPNGKPAEVGNAKKIFETPPYKANGTEAAVIERLAPDTTLEKANRKSKRFASRRIRKRSGFLQRNDKSTNVQDE